VTIRQVVRVFGHYGDGDLDILLTGVAGSSEYISRVYRNDGGSFVDIVAGLPLEIQGAQRRGINCWIRVDMDGAQSETLDDLEYALNLFGLQSSGPRARRIFARSEWRPLDDGRQVTESRIARLRLAPGGRIAPSEFNIAVQLPAPERSEHIPMEPIKSTWTTS
jgi:hypothetical protein